MVRSKELKSFPNYIVYEDGQIYSKSSCKFLNPFNKLGYKYFSIYLGDNKWKHYAIHRAVAECFIPNPDNLKCVNHIDCNRANNRVENLEWVSHQGNTDHMMKLGRHRVLKGEEDPKHKLKDTDIVEIRTRYHLGESQKSLAKEFKVERGYIGAIIRGETRKTIDEDLAPIQKEDGRKGERKHNAIFTEADIYKIAELWNSCEYTGSDIGELFNTSKGVINGIISRKTWKHVPILVNPETSETITKRKKLLYDKVRKTKALKK